MSTQPRRLGKYGIVEEMDYGGLAAVYIARDPTLERIAVLEDAL